MATQEFMAMGASNGAPYRFYNLSAGGFRSYWDAVDLPGADGHEKYLNACYLIWNIKSLTSFAIEGYIAGWPEARIRTPELTQLMYKTETSTDTEPLLEDIEPFARVCLSDPLSKSFVFQFTEILEDTSTDPITVMGNHPGIFAFQIGFYGVGPLKLFYTIQAENFANPAIARASMPDTPYPYATFDFQVGPKAGDTVTLEVWENMGQQAFFSYFVLDNTEVTPEFWSY